MWKGASISLKSSVNGFPAMSWPVTQILNSRGSLRSEFEMMSSISRVAAIGTSSPNARPPSKFISTCPSYFDATLRPRPAGWIAKFSTRESGSSCSISRTVSWIIKFDQSLSGITDSASGERISINWGSLSSTKMVVTGSSLNPLNTAPLGGLYIERYKPCSPAWSGTLRAKLKFP